MAFVIKKKETFIWPIKLSTPSDGGSYDEQQIDLEFKFLKSKEVKKLLNDKDSTDINFCKKVIQSWKDVTDESGKEIKFSTENLDSLLDTFGYAKDIVDQYLKALSGIVEKN